jgi:hypothetical protein
MARDIRKALRQAGFDIMAKMISGISFFEVSSQVRPIKHKRTLVNRISSFTCFFRLLTFGSFLKEKGNQVKPDSP